MVKMTRVNDKGKSRDVKLVSLLFLKNDIIKLPDEGVKVACKEKYK